MLTMEIQDIQDKTILNLLKTKKGKISQFQFAMQTVFGYCDYQCEKVTENKDTWEGGIGFEEYPEKHTKWCVRACKRFYFISKYNEDDKILFYKLEGEINDRSN